MKIIVVFVLILIVGSLGSALFVMLKDHGQSDRTVKALTIRVGLSIGLFLLLVVGYAMGLITPHPL